MELTYICDFLSGLLFYQNESNYSNKINFLPFEFYGTQFFPEKGGVRTISEIV